MTQPDPTTQTTSPEPVEPGGAQGTPPAADEPKTFDLPYVQKLREEAAGHRVKAQRADEAVSRLTAATVEKVTAGILADPSDLPVTDDLMGEDGWPDPEKIEAAARDLVARKPHLADRRPAGDVGQGPRGDEVETVSLAALLRAGAS